MYSLYDPNPYQQAYWGLCITWGLAVTIALYSTASVSGCHANPAVTLALACFRRFSWRKVIPYCTAQVLGGFAGTVIVYMLFSPVIDAFNTAHHLTRAAGGAAGVFLHTPVTSSSPGTHLPTRSSLPPFSSSASLRSPSSTTSRLPALILAPSSSACSSPSSVPPWATWRRGPSIPHGISVHACFLLLRRLGRFGVAFARQLLVDSDCCAAAGRRTRRRRLPTPHPPVPAGAPSRAHCAFARLGHRLRHPRPVVNSRPRMLTFWFTCRVPFQVANCLHSRDPAMENPDQPDKNTVRARTPHRTSDRFTL